MKRKKKKQLKDLRNASPVEVAAAFAGEIMLLSGEEAVKFDGDVVPSKLRSLDKALGIGGLPKGRIVEIFGPQSAGKTSLALRFVARVQKSGGRAAFIDAEHAIDLKYTTQLGVDVPNLMLNQPDSGEAALELVHKLMRTRAADIIVVDSVAALVPLREQEKDVTGMTMGMQANMMSKALRIMNPRVRKSNTLLIFINQTRMKVGVVFGNPETTSGGRALPFYAAVRIEIKPAGAYKKSGKVRGMDSRVRIVKNKCAVPFQTARLRLLHGEGWKSLKKE